MALVRALGPGQLAVGPAPARLAVALSVHTDAVVGACRVQAIHCKDKTHTHTHIHTHTHTHTRTHTTTDTHTYAHTGRR